ncbi:MAG: hypothetical protein NVSMB48_27430 [Marmoricola sp.]
MVQIIGAALSCYRRYPLLFAALALGVVVPYALAVRAADGSTLLASRHGIDTAQLTLALLAVLLVSPLISALFIHALIAIGEGRRPALSAVLRKGMRVIPVVAAADIVAGLGIALGLVALIVPGVLLAIRWAVVAPVAAVEPVAWPQALRRSGELTRRSYLHVLGLLALIAVIELAITRGTGAAVGRGAGPPEVLLGILIVTITRSFGALTSALLYFDLVARKTEPVRRPEPEYQAPKDLDVPN